MFLQVLALAPLQRHLRHLPHLPGLVNPKAQAEWQRRLSSSLARHSRLRQAGRPTQRGHLRPPLARISFKARRFLGGLLLRCMARPHRRSRSQPWEQERCLARILQGGRLLARLG